MRHPVKSLSLALGIACISSQNLLLAQQQNDDALLERLGRQSAIKQENTARESAIATGILPQAGEDKPSGDASIASSVDADAAALQAAIRQAIQDLQVRRKAQQQALAAQTAQAPNRHAPEWLALHSTQKKWLKPLANVWHELPSADRYAWMQLASQLPKMPLAAQEQAQDRMKQWSTLTPHQRQAARENFRLAQKLNDSKLSEGQLQALWERYRELTPEQRAVLRAAGQTASTAARHAGAATPLAKEAARPLPALDRHGKPTP